MIIDDIKQNQKGTKLISISVPKDLAEIFSQLCKESNVSVSRAVSELIKRELKAGVKNNDL